MATVQKRGPYQWRVQIRKKGFPPQTRTFGVRSEADAWARQIEGEMDRGLFVSRKEAENTTLSEALDRYEREVSSKKRSSNQDRIYVRYWKKTGLAARNLASIQGKDLAIWRDERLLAVKPATVDRELRIISHLFTIAVKEWGMAGLVNPVLQIRKPKLPPGRDRRLGIGELEKILSNPERLRRKRDNPLLPVFRFRKRHRPFLQIHHLPGHPGNLSPAHGRFKSKTNDIGQVTGFRIGEDLFQFS